MDHGGYMWAPLNLERKQVLVTQVRMFLISSIGQSHQKQSLALIQARMRRMDTDKWCRGD